MFLLTALPLCAQPEEDLAENLAELSDQSLITGTDLLISQVESHLSQPIDINHASREELEQSGLFSPFQVYGIMKHREKYGLFFSIYELRVVPGFTIDRLKLIESFLIAPPVSIPAPVKRNSFNTLQNISILSPIAEGYSSKNQSVPAYPGSPVKISGRVNYKKGNHWNAGISWEKDPGEAFIHQMRPEHIAGFIQYKGTGFLRNLILGNYRVHRGFGLVHGTGMNYGLMPVHNGFQIAYGRPFASTMEYDYYRGIYAEGGAGRIRSDIYISHIPVDMSLSTNIQYNNMYDRQRKTGLHRTTSEREGSNTGRALNIGSSISCSGKHFNTGLAASFARFSMDKKAADSLALLPDFHELSGNSSLYAIWFRNNIEIYSEYALDHLFRHAFLLGTNISFNPALEITMAWRDYSEDFISKTPAAFGSSGKPENEEGLAFGIQLVPFPRAVLKFNTDIYTPKISEKGYSPPGFNARTRLIASWSQPGRIEAEFRYNEKFRQSELAIPGLDNNLTGAEVSRSARLQCRFFLTDSLILTSRAELSFGAINGRSGKLMYQQISFAPWEYIRITYRFQLFSIPDWNLRIYSYEPGVLYSFSVPSWNGTGSRNLLVINAKIKDDVRLRLKLGVTSYAHTHFTGSGNDLRKGNCKTDLEIQLQYKLTRH